MNYPDKAVDLKSWEEKIKNYTEEDSEVSAEVVEPDETLHLTLGMVGHPVRFFFISFFFSLLLSNEGWLKKEYRGVGLGNHMHQSPKKLIFVQILSTNEKISGQWFKVEHPG